MVKFSIEQIENVMSLRDNIRNISVIAHVDHGKTTLSDSLVSLAGIIPANMSGDTRFMDGRKDEIARGITIKSSAVSLFFEHEGKPFLINLIDSPGHVDFSSEVTAALRVTDGALVVIDAVEGVCVQTETVLRQAIREKVRPVLFVNKTDRLLLELKYTPEEAYQSFHRAILGTNVVVGSISPSIDDESSSDGTTTTSTSDDQFNNILLDPTVGNVAFGSGYQGWGFTIERFAKIYEAKLGVPASKLIKRLWGDNYYDSSDKRWKTVQNEQGTLERGFCKFILDPIYRIVQSVMDADLEKLKSILKTVGVELEDTALKSKVGKDLLKLVMRAFLPVDNCILTMVVRHLPSPVMAQRYRYSHLYKGPLDDECALAMKNCDPNGPLMMFVSKMIPSDGGRFIAFGRVFSGTIRGGQQVRILGPEYEPGKKTDLYVKNVQNTVLMMGHKVERITQCTAGNIVGLTGVDNFLVKTGTIASSPEAHAIQSLKFSVSPVVRVSVTPKIPSELPKLIEGIKRLVKTDPAIQCYQDDSGDHIIAAVGELQMEICLNDLRDIAGIEINSSDPVVSYRETVTAKSPICLSKSPNKHNRIYMTAEPMESDVTDALENNNITMMQDPQSRHRALEELGWDVKDSKNLWAFGPQIQSSNALINSTTGIQNLLESKEFIVSSFNWASSAGPLADEPIRGVKFNLVDFVGIADAIHRGGGQIIPPTRRCIYACMLTGTPRLMEPVYLADIQVPEQGLGGVHSALGRRRGIIINETQSSRGLFSVQAYLPVAESFGFPSFLSQETSGRAFLQMVMDHYSPIESDPLAPSTRAKDIVSQIRVRKGLKPEVNPLSDYLDRL